jgi:hypothetical protein
MSDTLISLWRKMKVKLMTRAEYDRVSPYTQGYAVYWEGNHPESELHGLTNPYAEGSPEYAAWNRGQTAAAADDEMES